MTTRSTDAEPEISGANGAEELSSESRRSRGGLGWVDIGFTSSEVQRCRRISSSIKDLSLSFTLHFILLLLCRRQHVNVIVLLLLARIFRCV